MAEENITNSTPGAPGSPPPKESKAATAVGIAPGRNIIILGVIVLLAFYIIYNLLFSEPSEPVPEPPKPLPVTQDTGAIMPPPPPPAPVPPPPPPPPPPPLPTAGGGKGGVEAFGKSDERYIERVRSNMLIASGTAPAVSSLLGGFPEGTSEEDVTKSPRVRATMMGNLNYMVAQGKLIDATLETAINTDLPGTLRAVVNRDVYAENGKNIMIQKGSRLIGSYTADVRRGQSRVFIVWTRVIRPDGIDIQIDSPAVDQLGRSGVTGMVDNKFLETFGNAILLNTITIAVAYAADKITDSQGKSTTNNSNGSQTQTTDGTAEAIETAVTNTGETVRAVISSFINLKPTITIDQGTRMKVFVNRDLIFPPNLLKDVRFVN